MKFKPIKINELNSICEQTRYNENTVGICSSINSSNIDIDKKDYSTISLISIMYEKKILKHEMIEESFDEAKTIIDYYEGNN